MNKFYLGYFLKKLANLQLAIGLLLTIGIVVAIGTIIEQDQTVSFYQQNYPASRPIFGFVTWKLLLFFNFDHVYTSYWFLFLLFLFALSLLSCTLSVQLPVLRRLRRWKFYTNTNKTSGIRSIVPLNIINSIAYELHVKNYNVFRQGKKLYAYSGLMGRFGPIVVHASIICLLFGSTVGSFSSYTAQEIVPRGECFHIQNLVNSGKLSNISQNVSWRVNDFWITYTEEFKTNQFYSDLSLIDNFGNEIKRKTIFVNEPFIYKGLTLYQTDWDLVGLKVSLNDTNPVQIPLKKVTKGSQKFWFGVVRINSLDSLSKSFSILINDLRGIIYIYNSEGILIKECKIGQSIYLTNSDVVKISNFLTSTGLQIKLDPGLGIVYFSFFLLMLSTYVSFLSYSQIWGAETISNVKLVGTSNRAMLFFQAEYRKLVNRAVM